MVLSTKIDAPYNQMFGAVWGTNAAGCLRADGILSNIGTRNRSDQILIMQTTKNQNMAGAQGPRHCSPIWHKWNGSSGQTLCPCPTCPTKIDLVPLVPPRSEDPLLLVPLVPLRSEDALLLVPLVPRFQLVPTCPIWLYHLSFANSLFSDFFFGFLGVIPFFENAFQCKVFFKVLSCWRRY